MFNTMLSVGRCRRWYGCLRKSSTKIVISFLNDASSKSVCLSHRKFVSNRTQCRHMSVNNDSEPKNQSNAEKLLKDATVPEESTVEGDTENWTTSPYPKG